MIFGYDNAQGASEEAMADKYDDGKLRYSLLPWEAIKEVVRVLEFGAMKYEAHGWKNVPNGTTRYFDAMMRHTFDDDGRPMLAGQRDLESGLLHSAHRATDALFLLFFDLRDIAMRRQRIPISDTRRAIDATEGVPIGRGTVEGAK